MSRILLFCFFLAALAQPGRAQNAPYAADLIPKALLAHANAVVRTQEISTEVKALDQVIYKYREAITILNPQGAEYAEIAVYYDKSRQIKNLRAVVYDQNGRQIKKAVISDFQDVSAISDFSLFEDNRVKHFSPMVSYYPYTVEYEYEMRIKHSFYFPQWIPQKAADIAIQSSTFRFLSKADYQLRLKEFNLPAEKKESLENSTRQLEWRATAIPAIRPEPYSPPAEAFLTMVEIAPVSFEYEGIAGRFSNWQEYGTWVYDHLIKGRDQLPPATVAQVRALVQNLDSPKEKVRKVYEYAQQKNRYISVQIGIGGLQPMKAEEVDRLAYGDCKALTNYTKSLLQVAGIPSIYTEVHAGNRKQNYLADFASAFQGNHAILCVPMAADTIWLECTSREAPMGYLGSFTDDRKVLLCTEKGGIIAKTKSYKPGENRQIRTADLQLLPEGKVLGRVETRFEGTQYDNRENLIRKSPKDQIAAFKDVYPINNLEILKYDLQQLRQDNPATIEKLEIQVPQFGTVNSNLLFVPLNPLNTGIGIPKEVRNRKNKLFINRGFTDEDEIRFDLPTGFRTEYLPAPVVLQNEFGTYAAQAVLQGTQLVYTRKLVLNQGEFAPEAYEKFHSFLKKVADADQEKFVLARKD